MSSTDEVIAKAREALDRTSMNYAVGPRRAQRESDVGKRLTRAAVADLAIIGIAVTIGLVFGPIGIMGFFLMLVAMVIATAVLLATPTSRPVTYERLQRTDLKALPAQTGRWLWNLGRIDGAMGRPDLTPETVAGYMQTMPSGFGELSAVRHSAILSKTPAMWARPSVPLGTDPPEWPVRG